MKNESKLQAEIIRYLKRKGCYVIKTAPGAGTPVGCPDIIALYGNEWLVIECKVSAKSEFQPLQEITLKNLKKMSPFVYIVHKDNWNKIRTELENTFLS